jgi:hypothetical protein
LLEQISNKLDSKLTTIEPDKIWGIGSHNKHRVLFVNSLDDELLTKHKQTLHTGIIMLAKPPEIDNIHNFALIDDVILLTNDNDNITISTQALDQVSTNIAVLATTNQDYIFQQKGDYWLVVFEDKTAKINNTKGMNYIHQLLLQPHKPIKSLTLYHGGNSELAGQVSHKGDKIYDDKTFTTLKNKLENAKELGNIEAI